MAGAGAAITGALTGTEALAGAGAMAGMDGLAGGGTGVCVRYMNQAARIAARCPGVNVSMQVSGTYAI
jgi:hypothetical protein